MAVAAFLARCREESLPGGVACCLVLAMVAIRWTWAKHKLRLLLDDFLINDGMETLKKSPPLLVLIINYHTISCTNFTVEVCL